MSVGLCLSGPPAAAQLLGGGADEDGAAGGYAGDAVGGPRLRNQQRRGHGAADRQGRDCTVCLWFGSHLNCLGAGRQSYHDLAANRVLPSALTA